MSTKPFVTACYHEVTVISFEFKRNILKCLRSIDNAESEFGEFSQMMRDFGNWQSDA